MARPTRTASTAIPTLVLALALGACAADPVVAPARGPINPSLDVDAGGDAAASAVDPAAAGGAAKRGRITITLVMRPEGPADVSFTTDSRKLRDFVLDDDANPTLPNTLTFTNVKPGSYAIQMATAPDGPLTAIRCTSTGGTDDNVVDVQTRTATVNVEAGEAVTCTFIDGWEAGDLVTHNQGGDGWDEPYETGGALLARHFDTLYPAGFTVGGFYYMRFWTATAVYNYLPQSGPPGVLTANSSNPTDSPAGVLGGFVVAMRLNLDFSDAGFLPSAVPLGTLLVCGYFPHGPNDAVTVHGVTVSAFAAVANALLGGEVQPGLDPESASIVLTRINSAFLGGAPSAFAQEHLFVGGCP